MASTQHASDRNASVPGKCECRQTKGTRVEQGARGRSTSALAEGACAALRGLEQTRVAQGPAPAPLQRLPSHPRTACRSVRHQSGYPRDLLVRDPSGLEHGGQVAPGQTDTATHSPCSVLAGTRGQREASITSLRPQRALDQTCREKAVRPGTRRSAESAEWCGPVCAPTCMEGTRCTLGHAAERARWKDKHATGSEGRYVRDAADPEVPNSVAAFPAQRAPGLQPQCFDLTSPATRASDSEARRGARKKETEKRMRRGSQMLPWSQGPRQPRCHAA